MGDDDYDDGISMIFMCFYICVYRFVHMCLYGVLICIWFSICLLFSELCVLMFYMVSGCFI